MKRSITQWFIWVFLISADVQTISNLWRNSSLFGLRNSSPSSWCPNLDWHLNETFIWDHPPFTLISLGIIQVIWQRNLIDKCRGAETSGSTITFCLYHTHLLTSEGNQRLINNQLEPIHVKLSEIHGPCPSGCLLFSVWRSLFTTSIH